MKTKKLILCTLLLSGSLSHAEVFLRDSFVTGSISTNGEYGTGNLRDVSPSATGGTIVGFSSGSPWSVNTALPEVVSGGLSSPALPGAGGAVSFRGSADSLNRVAYRPITAYTVPATTYFNGTFRVSVLDDDALSFIAYSQNTSTIDQFALHVMGDASTPHGYAFDGVAFGVKGNGAGGMDLVIRYRGADSIYVDTVLLAGITAGTAYNISGKIDWNTTGTGADPLTVWVDGRIAAELTGSLGDGSNINTVGLVQRSYGAGLSNTVSMDELRLASTQNDMGLVLSKRTSLILISSP